jgi:hypothetical protein
MEVMLYLSLEVFLENNGGHAVPFVGGLWLERMEVMLYLSFEVFGWKEWRSCCTFRWRSLVGKNGAHAVPFVGSLWLERMEVMLYLSLEVVG